jgi:chromate transporter
MNQKNPSEVTGSPKVSLWKIFSEYLLVGLTAFSMAILQKLKSLVMRNKWLSEEDMNEGLALVQMYPGPLMVDFTAYVGYKLRGVKGAVLATLGFILPSFLMMIALSSLYFAAANLSWIHLIFSGLEALVVGVILNVTIDLGGKALKGKIEAVIALLAFAVLLLKVNAI